MANIIEIDRINNVIIMGTTGTTTRFPFLTATRMTYLNGERDITSISDLTAWVKGTANEIVSTDGGDGTVTLSLSTLVSDISGLTPTDGNFIVGNGTTWVAESGATARTSLGLGTGNSPQFTGLTLTGHIGAGGESINADVGIFYKETFTNFGNVEKIGVDGHIVGIHTDAARTSIILGNLGRATIGAANTQNWTHTSYGIIGTEGAIRIVSDATGTVTNAVSLLARCEVFGATITNWKSLFVENPAITLPGSIINAYGIYVDDINEATTLNYAIYTNAGLVHFGGAVSGAGGAAICGSGTTLVTFTASDNEPPSANGAAADTRNSIPVLDFDADANEVAEFGGFMPRNYAGSGVTVTLGWMATDTTVTPHEVFWGVAFKSVTNDADDLDTKSYAVDNSVADEEASASGEVSYCEIAFTNGADMDSVAAGEYFRLRVTRVADSGSDTLTDDAELVFVEVRET